MLETTPLVSVLMPVYNGEVFIAEAIESVLNQSYTNFELIICDDGSTDNTSKIIKSFEDKRISVFNHLEREGIPVSRNELLARSKGNFVSWIDADDIYFPKKLEKQVQFLLLNPEYSVCLSDVIVFNHKKSTKTNFPNNPALLKHILFFRQPVFFSSTIARKYQNISFNTQLKRTQDFEYLWLLSQKGKFEIIKDHLVKYRLVENSNKPDFDNTLIEQLYNQRKKLEKIEVQCNDTEINTLNKFLRDIKSCNKNEALLALDVIEKVYNSNKIIEFGLEKKYLKAIYTYQVLKAGYFCSLTILKRAKFVSFKLLRDLIHFKM